MNSNWYSRQLEQIADMHGSIAARSPAQLKGLIMRCVGVSITDDAASKIASVAKNASDESEIEAVLRESGKLPAAAAKALARSIMPNG